jgi:glycosyltransferase involved in cell wall biosynthesis
MTLGRPVVASDLPGNLEVLGEAGVSFPAGDASTLAAAVATLLGDPRRRMLLCSLGRTRSARWHPDTMADRVVAAYRDLLQPEVCAAELV